MDIFKKLNSLFWNQRLWFPANTTWEIIGDTSKVNYAQFKDLYYSFYVAIILFVVRYLLEWFVFFPLGCYFGLKPETLKKNENNMENAVLEKKIFENGKIHYEQVQGLAKQLDWSERKVERWIRKRARLSNISTLKKFTETGWFFTFHFCGSCYAFYALWDKPWVWSIKSIWLGYPHHSVTSDIWWFFMLNLGFYLTELFSPIANTKRKDSVMAFVHHVLTIVCVIIAWTSNCFRMGTLFLVINHLPLSLLMVTKMARYVENLLVSKVIFALFVPVWIICRLYILPFWLLYSSMFDSGPLFPALQFLIAINCIISVMSILWTWMILKVVIYSFLSAKSSEFNDLRSDDDDSTSSESEASMENISCQNKNK